jgi:hypothetical protein
MGSQEHGNADAPAQELGTREAAVVGRLIYRDNSNISSSLRCGSSRCDITIALDTTCMARLESALKSQSNSVFAFWRVYINATSPFAQRPAFALMQSFSLPFIGKPR